MDQPAHACTSLPDLFAGELATLTRLERQLATVLTQARHEAFSLRLRDALLSQESQLRSRWRRLAELAHRLLRPLEAGDAPATGLWVCAGDPAITDAALIAQLQRLGHLLLAAYGTARTWALHLEHAAVAELLQLSLDEVRALDRRLTDLAESGINALAAAGSRTGIAAATIDTATLM